MIVVIPSSCAVRLDYLSPLIDSGARFIVVDDSEGSIHIDHPQFSVYNWSHQRKMLGNLENAIPRRNGACRDFGFYVAWSESSDDEIIVALDDDCQVDARDFAAEVERSLSRATRPVATGRGQQFNVLDLYEDIDANLYPRGFPYSQRVGHERGTFQAKQTSDIVFNLGLWRGIFDVNAIDKICIPQYTYPDAILKHDQAVVPDGVFISVCSMNMQFRRAVLPAVYQLPMHVEVMPKWVIDRYGDIWGGFILKTLMDVRGDAMAFGGPMIRHLKEGSYQRNIWQEHLCHLVNDEFLDLLLEVREHIRPAPYVDMMENLAEAFASRRYRTSPILKAYLSHLDASFTSWVCALRRAAGSATSTRRVA